MKKIQKCLIVLFAFIVLFFAGCNVPAEDNKECKHNYVMEVTKEATCTKDGEALYTCSKCGDSYEQTIESPGHDFYEVNNPATCTEEGYSATLCHNCNYKSNVKTTKATGHSYVYVTDIESKDGSIGYKHCECEKCHDKEEKYAYINTGYSRYGRLHVQGPDLVDKDGNQVQLIGISTHGLQWFGQYVNYDTLLACKEAFNINIYRFSLYTSENGYCCCSETRKEQLYQMVVSGIKIATSLDMYVIVDWHMLGADDPNDKNPLYYKDEAIEFFDRITSEFADYDNIFYEIMNEPCGSTTWNDCKEYAEAVIPVIRKNDPDAIVLVGNPKWSSDLTGPTNSPLNYDNLMYVMHFYADDNCNTYKIVNAYKAGVPIFVTEHGGMNAEGDGSINYESIKKWYSVLDGRNISYVAWNLSNSTGSSAMIKKGYSAMDDFSDDALKIWGQYYKAHIKTRLGLN